MTAKTPTIISARIFVLDNVSIKAMQGIKSATFDFQLPWVTTKIIIDTRMNDAGLGESPSLKIKHSL